MELLGVFVSPFQDPFRAGDVTGRITWASARGARFSPGFNIAGFQP